MKKILLLAIIALTIMQAKPQHNIIPEPYSYTKGNNTLTIKGKIAVEIISEIDLFTEQFYKIMIESGVEIIKTNETVDKSIPLLQITCADTVAIHNHKEAYNLHIKNNAIKIKAKQEAGIFYGLQTLIQLFPPDVFLRNGLKDKQVELQECTIEDFPRFEWRGLMLDVSRHFFEVEEIKRFIDQMAHYKFNTFHWHLTDDEGWRIEIKSLPRLTEVGAWRVERHGKFGKDRPYPTQGEKSTYGGFYTQTQIKEIVAYAADRNITIVPEIDMPGHCMAALAAYPELSTQKEPKFVNPGSKFVNWFGNGKFEMLIENTLNPADENVYDFIDKVMTEVADLFPGEYIHIGGDEAYHGFWERSDKVQQFMKKNSIKDAHALQSYFIGRVEKIVRSKNKKAIGWDEILDGELSGKTAVMSWRGMKGGIKAAQQKHKVVMSPTTFAYLDYMQGDESVENRIYAALSLEKCYNFEPLPENIDSEYIMGGQGNLWTEAVPTIDFAFYMAYPRAFALSETLWSQADKKDWAGFICKTENHFERFDNKNINISKAVFDPIINVKNQDDKLICTLTNPMPDTEIYYTTNNTYPVKFGKKYTKPFVVPEGDLFLRTQTYRNGVAISRELIIHRDKLVTRAK